MSTATYFFVKTDFGIMQCTPLRTSTTIETGDPPARACRPCMYTVRPGTGRPT